MCWIDSLEHRTIDARVFKLGLGLTTIHRVIHLSVAWFAINLGEWRTGNWEECGVILVINQLDALFNVLVYFISLHVSSNPVLIIRRINCINTSSGLYHSVEVTVWYAGPERPWYQSPTQSDTNQMMYWYNWFSWWWALGCSKHVEKWNKWVH